MKQSLIFLLFLIVYPNLAYSENYLKCARVLWQPGKTPISSGLHSSRETTPGPICVSFPSDYIVKEAFCGVFYPTGPQGGTHSCILGRPCIFDTYFDGWTDEIHGSERRICVYMHRTNNYFVKGKFLLRAFKPR